MPGFPIRGTRRLLAPLGALCVLACVLVQPTAADAAFGYLAQFGSSQLSSPLGVATDASGNVYVADCSLNVVKKFDASGGYLTQFGSGTGTGDGQFNCARDVAVNSNGVYVVDYTNNRVQQLNATTGDFIRQWGSFGTGNGQFEEPVSITTDTSGYVYVGDKGPTSSTTQRVQKFDATGVYQTTIGSSANYGKPLGLATDSANNLYVSDQTNSRIVKFNSAGVYQTTWNSLDTTNDQLQGIAADSSNNVYVAVWGTNRIEKFSSTGSFLGQWGSSGSGNEQFSGPMDVATYATGNLVYVADQNNHRIVKYGEGATALPTVVTGDATGVTWLVGTLNGSVNPQGTATSYYFEYGTTTSYGTQTATTSAGAGTADLAATGAMTGLMAERVYHYRIVGLRGGTPVAWGEDRSFSTWPDPGGAVSCARAGHTVGVVGVCADTMSYSAGRWTASGNVVLNTGVAVSGEVVINDGLKLITSSSGVTLTVQRSTPVTIGSGPLSIAAGGVSDPVSNRSNLGVLTIGSPMTIALANVPIVPLVTNYLDATDGGGVIITGRPSFDFLSAFGSATLPTGSFSIGINRTASKPFRFLGGSVKWDAVQLSPLWKIGFNVGYAEGPPSLLSLMGKFEAPFLPSGTGAELSGAFSGGRLDALGIKISTPGVPLGSTGIIMDTFGGSLKGLSGGANNPLIISALVGGGWTKTGAPEPFNWILHIKDVTLTINTAGSGSLSGELDVVDGEGRLVKGTASLTLQLSPTFLASGSFTGTFNAVAVSANLGFSAALNTSHFTAQGNVSGSMLGVQIGSGSGVLSDKGIGATTHVCIPYWWFGWHQACSDIGAGLTWSKVRSFPPPVDWIGSDINQYVTIQASAAATGRAADATRRFTVKRRDPFLYIEARGKQGRNFELISPNGIHYGPGIKRRDTFSQTIGNVTGLAVYGPAPGSWRLRTTTTARTRFSVQTIPALGKVRPRSILPASTKRKPLPRKLRSVRLSWTHSGTLPRDTRLSLYLATSKKAPGKLLRTGLRSSGHTTLKVSALRKGANYLYLVPGSKGIQFDIARFAAPVWKR